MTKAIYYLNDRSIIRVDEENNLYISKADYTDGYEDFNEIIIKSDNLDNLLYVLNDVIKGM